MYKAPEIHGFDDEDPLDPKRKIFDALSGPSGGSAVDPLQGVNGAAGAELPPVSAPSQIAAPSAAPKPFQSGNASVSGYLQDAMKSFAPTIHGIKDEAGRKSALRDYLTSIAPEVQARGGTLSNIGLSDKAKVDGRTIDFFGDIEGAATPQFLDVTDEVNRPQGGGGGGGGAMGGMPLDALMSGDPMAKIQAALAQFTGPRSNAEALLAALGGR